MTNRVSSVSLGLQEANRIEGTRETGHGIRKTQRSGRGRTGAEREREREQQEGRGGEGGRRGIIVRCVCGVIGKSGGDARESTGWFLHSLRPQSDPN